MFPWKMICLIKSDFFSNNTIVDDFPYPIKSEFLERIDSENNNPGNY